MRKYGEGGLQRSVENGLGRVHAPSWTMDREPLGDMDLRGREKRAIRGWRKRRRREWVSCVRGGCEHEVRSATMCRACVSKKNSCVHVVCAERMPDTCIVLGPEPAWARRCSFRVYGTAAYHGDDGGGGSSGGGMGWQDAARQAMPCTRLCAAVLPSSSGLSVTRLAQEHNSGSGEFCKEAEGLAVALSGEPHASGALYRGFPVLGAER